MTWGVLLGLSSTGCVSSVTPWGGTKCVSCWEVVVSLVLSSSPLIVPCASPPGISQLLIQRTASVESAASRIVRGLIPTSHGLEWGNVTIVSLALFFQCVLPLTFFLGLCNLPRAHELFQYHAAAARSISLLHCRLWPCSSQAGLAQLAFASVAGLPVWPCRNV